MSLLEFIANYQPCYVDKKTDYQKTKDGYVDAQPPLNIEWGEPIPLSYKMYSFVIKHLPLTKAVSPISSDILHFYFVDSPDDIYQCETKHFYEVLNSVVATQINKEICTICKIATTCHVAQAFFTKSITGIDKVFNPSETGAQRYLTLKHAAALVDNLIAEIDAKVKAGEKTPVTDGLLAVTVTRRRVYTKAGEDFLKNCNAALASQHLAYTYKPLTQMTKEAAQQLLDNGFMEYKQYNKVQVGYEEHPQHQVNTPDISMYETER